MIKKDIKAYVKERKVEIIKELNNLVGEYEAVQKNLEKAKEEGSELVEYLEKSAKTQEDEVMNVRKDAYVWSLFEIVVDHSKYLQKGIKLMKHDFEEITEEVIENIAKETRNIVLENLDIDESYSNERLKEKTLVTLVKLYHAYTGATELNK